MRRRIAPLALVGAAAMLLSGCGALGGAGGSGADLNAETLQQRVEEIAQKNGADGIIGLDLYLSGGEGCVDISTDKGLIGKSLDTGEDRYAEPMSPRPSGTIAPADYPYAELVERAKEPGCPKGNDPVQLRSTVTPVGSVFMQAQCDEGTGNAWLNGEQVPKLTDPYAEKSLETVLAEAEQTVGPELLELSIMGPDGPLGEEGTGYTIIASEQQFFGKPCRPMAIRPLAPSGDLYLMMGCDEGAKGAPFAIADYPAADLRAAIEFGMEHLGMQSSDEIASVRAYAAADGKRYLEIIGTDMTKMSTVSLDEG
ncbi:hypothetical protein [Leucobacter luti]|uniref:hypothetical protein n=1 Tax=Leucobacter luti TaxID=340320 RepID=UPI003D093BCB